MRLFRTIGFRSKAAIIALSFAPPMGALAWQHFNSRAGQIEVSASPTHVDRHIGGG